MNIDKFRTRLKIKSSSDKHRGNALKVATELNLPVAYVSEEIKRIRSASKREYSDVNIIVAEKITEVIMEGYRQRVSYIEEMLEKLSGREQEYVSVCCDFAYHKLDVSGYGCPPVYHCHKCGKLCEIKKVDKDEVYSRKQELINELRKEHKEMVKFAESMGYTFKDPEAMVKVYKNYLVMKKEVNGNIKVASTSRQTEVIDVDAKDAIVADIDKMDGPEAEKVLRELEKSVDGKDRG